MDRSQRVAVISAEGKVLQQWGKPGTGPGEFHFMGTDTSDPNGYDGKIAVGSDGEVYVPDTENSRVQVFTPDGRFVRQFGRLGSGKGQFLFLFDLAVDDTGSIYLVDAQLNMIRKLSTDGKFVWQIGGSAADDPDLIAVEGTFHLSTFDSHGRLVVANDTNGRILYLDRDGHKVDAFGRSNLFLSYIGRDLGGPCEATVDAQGDTYVSACDKGPTLVFDRAHRLVAIWPGLPDPLFRSPVFGPNGEVFALTYDGDILRLRITLPQG
jgi:sugar lactone lactonase YvrE